MTEKPLRVVTCHSFYPTRRVVEHWAQQNGHEIVLMIIPQRRTWISYRQDGVDVLHNLPKDRDVLMTNRLRTTAASAVRALEPDVLVTSIYPRLIPREVTEIPRLGSVNLHPGPLPRSRGPNPGRLIYDGETTIGATLHRMEQEFDTGAILSVVEEELPEFVDAEAYQQAYLRVHHSALEMGMKRVIAGEWGEPQDDSLAGYAGQFTSDDKQFDFTEDRATVLRKIAALNFQYPVARIRIENKVRVILDAQAVDDNVSPGHGLNGPDQVIVRAGDGLLKLFLK